MRVPRPCPTPCPGLWLGFGHVIRTALPLPGAIPVGQGGEGTGDIDIGLHDGVEPDWSGARAFEVYRVVSADLFAIAVPGVARFLVHDRRRILVEPLPGSDPAHIADLLIATAIPALLWARGEIVLHASAFLLPGATRAIAVAGNSGSGKSRALGRALALGGGIVADDAIRVAVSEGRVTAHGLAGGYAERRADATRVFHPVPSARRVVAARLGAIAVLTPDATAPRRLSGVEALAALLRHRHRPRIAMLLGTEPALLPALATIAHDVTVIAVPMSQDDGQDPFPPVAEALSLGQAGG